MTDPHAVRRALEEARRGADRLAWMKPDRLDHSEDVRRIEKAARLAAEVRENIDAALAALPQEPEPSKLAAWLKEHREKGSYNPSLDEALNMGDGSYKP